jgi:hypothetical protein
MTSYRRLSKALAVGVVLSLLNVSAVSADTIIDGGEVNISGATLFVNFFEAPGSTNDWIDVDGDGWSGFQDYPPYVDQLAPLFGCPDWQGWWLVQYRGVGSGNGLKEFVDYQLLGLVPDNLPSEDGVINRILWAADGHGVDHGCGCEMNIWDPDYSGWDPNDPDYPPWQPPLLPPYDLPGWWNGECLYWLECDPNDPNSAELYWAGDEIPLNGEPWPWTDWNVIPCEDITTPQYPYNPNMDCCWSNTPYCWGSVDLAVMDVPTRWFVRTGDPNDGDWDADPGSSGYGYCPFVSWDTGYGMKLKSMERDFCGGRETISLNTNTDEPDEYTVYDTQVAWVPIAFIANRGTGIENITATELQYHFLTGRLSTGENLVAATRDAGSGTRNGSMNCMCLDPSWARGDNLGDKNDNDTLTNLGPGHQATNCGGSSIMEGAVQNRRLAMGYTGLAGAKRAAKDALDGKYEIANVIFDIRGGSVPVRPTVQSVIFNCDADAGYQVGGPETFASRGNPLEYDPNSPAYMANQAAADYLRNITQSIADFIDVPGQPEQYFMPGEYLALTFFLLDGIECLPNLADPCEFAQNPNLNENLRDYIYAHNDLGGVGDTPDYGITAANLVPKRNASPDWPEGSPYTDGYYGDGSSNGNYADFNGAFTVLGGVMLNERNALSGDFSNDDLRNWNDIADMMDAVQDPRGFVADEGLQGGDPGELGQDYVIPEIIGDYTGDGNFDADDVRYFADGLATDPNTGMLNREVGFTMVDEAYGGNYFSTVPWGGQDYQYGDSRFDVAGNPTSPGAHPTGPDGVVDCADLGYIYGNFGVWADLGDAVEIDLSCDMNGDMAVNEADVVALLGHPVADIAEPSDGYVGQGDLGVLLGNWNEQDVGYYGGDLNCDGVVGHADLGILLGHWNPPPP